MHPTATLFDSFVGMLGPTLPLPLRQVHLAGLVVPRHVVGLALLFRQQGSRQRYSLSWKGGVIVPASEFSFINGLFDMYFNYYFLWMTIYFSGNVMEVPS